MYRNNQHDDQFCPYDMPDGWEYWDTQVIFLFFLHILGIYGGASILSLFLPIFTPCILNPKSILNKTEGFWAKISISKNMTVSCQAVFQDR